jgi:RNA polymerase sigma factor (sigma-70 family)
VALAGVSLLVPHRKIKKPGDKMDHGSNAKEWAWVLQNAALIKNTALKEARKSALEFEDIHSALMIRVVEKLKNFDADKGTAKTWLYWQVRAVCSDLRSSEKRNSHALIEIEPKDSSNPQGRMHAAAEIAIIRPLATEGEWDSVFAKFEGLSGKETEARLGITAFSSRKRVLRFANKVERRSP